MGPTPRRVCDSGPGQAVRPGEPSSPEPHDISGCVICRRTQGHCPAAGRPPRPQPSPLLERERQLGDRPFSPAYMMPPGPAWFSWFQGHFLAEDTKGHGLDPPQPTHWPPGPAAAAPTEPRLTAADTDVCAERQPRLHG